MRDKTACFTGHRMIPAKQLSSITCALENTVTELIASGIQYFGCGGAIGFDMLAGFSILKLKEKYPHIRLIMVLPCRDQDKLWQQGDKDKYKELLSKADKVKFLQDEYDDDCMLRRNRHLVDNSNVCIAYMTRERGGTGYTVRYATKNSVRVINIAEKI